MAETLRRRLTRQDAFADEQAEPACHAWRRYALRYRAQRCWAGERDPALAADLGVAVERLRWVLRWRYFGGAWATLERVSPVLARRPVRFVDLPAEIAIARGLLAADKLAAD
jgi:hypothetical protein